MLKKSISLSEFEEQAVFYRQLYWRIRATRFVNLRRKWYRRAAIEKARLSGLVPLEVVRLYGLWLKAPGNEKRRQRFEQVFEQSRSWPEQLTLDFYKPLD